MIVLVLARGVFVLVLVRVFSHLVAVVRPFLNFVLTVVVTLVLMLVETLVAVVVVVVGLRTVVRVINVSGEAGFFGTDETLRVDEHFLVFLAPVDDFCLVLILYETLSSEVLVEDDGKCVVVVARATVFVL